jgi:hypothetical protein
VFIPFALLGFQPDVFSFGIAEIMIFCLPRYLPERFFFDSKTFEVKIVPGRSFIFWGVNADQANLPDIFHLEGISVINPGDATF